MCSVGTLRIVRMESNTKNTPQMSSVLCILSLGAKGMDYLSVHSEGGIGPERTKLPCVARVALPGDFQENAHCMCYIKVKCFYI